LQPTLKFNEPVFSAEKNSQILRRPQDDIDFLGVFANASSKGRTARSFGGLRMTVKEGDSHPSEASG
jgi:hypothetical protein